MEPAIIRARDTLMTRENYRSYSSNDYIYRHDVGDQALYSVISRTYDFDEHDPARVREAFDVELKPLGFDFREHVYEDDGRGSDTVLAWTSERYGVTVHIMVSESWRIFRDACRTGSPTRLEARSRDEIQLSNLLDDEGGGAQSSAAPVQPA